MHTAFGVVERAIAAGPIPGAAAAIGTLADHEQHACFGLLEPDGPAVTPDTWYDLASLTKVLVTVPLCLEALAAGRLDPQAPLRDLLPEVAWLQERPNLGDARVLDLATHTSGLPAWQPLYTTGLDRSTAFARLLHTPLAGPPGPIVYSDLGFLILGHLLERLEGERLDVLAKRLFTRLGLQDALAFAPPPGALVAPTERCPWRQRLLRGEVHDENAWALGGVAGHAGLFSTARDLAVFCRALLAGGAYGPARILGPDFVELLLTPPGLGFAVDQPWFMGELAGHGAAGHTGFTGTSLVIDPRTDTFLVLLANRVHPRRRPADSGPRAALATRLARAVIS
jgi:CubicO group peptidase (beta-lactamase class C family)